MGLGYSTNNTSNEISKSYQIIIDTLKKKDLHYEVKKHLITEHILKLRSYVIFDTFLDEILITDVQEMVIISGIFKINELSDTYIFMKIKKIDEKFETCFREIHSENIKKINYPVKIEYTKNEEWPELPKRKRN